MPTVVVGAVGAAAAAFAVVIAAATAGVAAQTSMSSAADAMIESCLLSAASSSQTGTGTWAGGAWARAAPGIGMGPRHHWRSEGYLGGRVREREKWGRSERGEGRQSGQDARLAAQKKDGTFFWGSPMCFFVPSTLHVVDLLWSQVCRTDAQRASTWVHKWGRGGVGLGVGLGWEPGKGWGKGLCPGTAQIRKGTRRRGTHWMSLGWLVELE